MKINKKLLPLKLHFFLFWASISSALPFMMVIARQLGVPVGIQGTISAVVITGSVLAKPVISAAADYLPGFRKAIFLALLTIMITTIGPIGFLPPMYTLPMYSGQLLKKFSNSNHTNIREFYLLSESSDSCQLTSGWDCKAACKRPDICPIGNSTLESIKVFFLDNEIHSLLTSEKRDSLHSTFTSIIRNRSNISSNQSDIYRLEGLPVAFTEADFDIRILCAGGERSGDDCVSPWYTLEFWIYITLLLAGQISATTAESISDAICLDTIGENGDYGSQRAWGALSYGILGTFSGYLVDWKSGSSIIKDYTPAFLLLVVFGTLDVLLSAGYLKVPKFEGGTAVWENLRPLLRQTHFFLFLCIAFLVGFFDGMDTGYVFILQEDMAAGTSTMEHMKFLQGLTMLVQALSAAPFMFIYDWFMKNMGSQKVIALVLFLYTIRLLGLALAGYFKLVWATIAIELINGPCFGLGYTAIIMQASSITPPGTSATVQSVVNICYGTLGYAGASLIGGILYEAVGGVWLYLATGILAAITCLLHVALLKFQSRTPENKEDNCPRGESSNIRKTDEDEFEMTNIALIEKCTTGSKKEIHSFHSNATSGERREQHETTETTMIKGEIT